MTNNQAMLVTISVTAFTIGGVNGQASGGDQAAYSAPVDGI